MWACGRLLWFLGLQGAQLIHGHGDAVPMTQSISGCHHYRCVQTRLGIFSVQVHLWRDAAFNFPGRAKVMLFSHTLPCFPASVQAQHERSMEEAACSPVTKGSISSL